MNCNSELNPCSIILAQNKEKKKKRSAMSNLYEEDVKTPLLQPSFGNLAQTYPKHAFHDIIPAKYTFTRHSNYRWSQPVHLRTTTPPTHTPKKNSKQQEKTINRCQSALALVL